MASKTKIVWVVSALIVSTLAQFPRGRSGGYGEKDSGYGGKDSGYGVEDTGYGGNDSGYGRKDTGYGGEDTGYGGKDSGYGGTDSGYGGTDSGYGGKDSGYGGKDTGYGGKDSGYGGKDSGYGGKDSGYGGKDSGYGGKDSGYGGKDTGYGGKDTGYGGKDTGYGGKDSGYGGKDSGYGGKDTGYGGKDTGYGGQGDGHYGHDGGHDGRNGHGYDGHDGAKHKAPSPKLAQLRDFIHKIGNEKVFLKKKVAMTKALKSDLLDKLEQIKSTTIPDLQSAGMAQNDRLNTIKDTIQSLSMTLGQLESDLAGQKVLGKTNEDTATPLFTILAKMASENNVQAASLTKISVSIDETEKKLKDKVATHADIASDQIEELRKNTMALKGLIDSRNCFSDLAIVQFNNSNNGHSSVDVTFDPKDIFGGNVPTVFCALESFETKLDLGSSRNLKNDYGNYNSNSYSDDRQNLALTVDCKPFSDKITVMAFDQSRGNDNSVRKAMVEVKACSLGAQA